MGPRKGGGKGRKGESRGDSGREYPRRSGTGRGRENSRSGGGKYNWGKEGDQGEKTEAQPEGAEAEQQPAAEAEPVIEEEPEEETMSIEEYEKLQADKNLNLNANTKERTVEKDDSLSEFTQTGVEDQYECMFHDPTKVSKKVSKKGRRGAKQADQVLNLKFVDESADAGKGKGGKGRKGESGGKGARSSGKGNASSKSNIDLSNDMAFPTLGA